ncbi:hypothetical protein CR203_10895 [Salipaludibacillus neizhouensis]|uniref:Uncharacterized protein n=1 Tax=Salipaludibacillus neizhouensis TaxID=885475 RepID=A0A3A9K9E8_9BACI|nr:hypothetical protein [Salipaludibacillus neizhouensis]RKL67021.1 hypothetical protein CR203_10895 [Salipaludibacillus neizhouensis]
MDLQTAYKIMDVSEDITIEKLEAQYLIWIRKDKAQQGKTRISSNDVINMDTITEAYNLILNYIQFTDNQIESRGGVREKIGHFIEHYKYHTLGILFLIFVFGSIMFHFIDHRIEQARESDIPPPDLEILLFGDYYAEDITVLENTLEKTFPEWENMEVNFEYSPTETTSEMDITSVQQRPLTLMIEEPDIYITDQTHFDLLLDLDTHLPIEIDISDDLKEQIGDHSLKFHQVEGEEKEELYGVDLSRSEVFSEVQIVGSEKIVSIRSETNNYENALTFIKKVLEKVEETE